jgi:hypothetical protein
MSWELTGNSGTNPNSNFLGTIDKQPLVIKTNGTERLRVDENGNVLISGVGFVGQKLEVTGDMSALNLEVKQNISAQGLSVSEFIGVNLPRVIYDPQVFASEPRMALDVAGRIRLRDGVGGTPAGTAGLWFYTAHSSSRYPSGSADIGFIGAVDATRIGLYGNDPRGGSGWGFTFDTVTGNVGIGTGIGYPNAKLQVNGDIMASKITCLDVNLIGGDCAEEFDIANAESVEAGTVMVLGDIGAEPICLRQAGRRRHLGRWQL